MKKRQIRSGNTQSGTSGASKKTITHSDQLLFRRARKRGKERAANLRRIEKLFKEAKREGWKEQAVKIGDRVQIMIPISGLMHRKIQTGVVTYRDGYYVGVRPHWLNKNREIECYDSELRRLK